MSGLSDLLQRLNTEHWSSRRIEKEAARHGHQLSNATAAKYIRGDHPDRPGADTLQALADVFSTDVDQLRAAAGLPGLGQPFELGADAARLTGPQREAIRTTVRLFIEQNDQLADRAVPDGSTIRLSDRRPRLLGGEDPSILEMPFAADEDKPGDDPGEDDH